MQINKPISTVLLFLATLVLVFFVVSPEYSNFRDLQKQVAIKNAEAEARVEYYNQVNDIYNKMIEIKDDADKVESSLPDDPNLGQLVYYFQNTALQNGLLGKSIGLSRVGSAKKGSAPQEIAFSLNLVGGYKQLENFIISLDKSSRMFEVTSIAFGAGVSQSAPQQAGQFQTQQTYNFNLEVKTYSY